MSTPQFFYAVYFGHFETIGCVLSHTQQTQSHQTLRFRSPSNDTKFKVVIDKDDDPHYATTKTYFEAVCHVIGEKVKEKKFIDGMTVSFPFFPAYLDIKMLEQELQRFVSIHSRPTESENPPESGRTTARDSKVFVMEEDKTWEFILRNRATFPEGAAVIYSHLYSFMRNKQVSRGRGFPGDKFTFEQIGLLGIEHVVQQRSENGDAGIENDPVFVKAKQLFEVDNFYDLMDKLRTDYSALKVAQLVEIMSRHKEFDSAFDRFGYEMLDKFVRFVWGNDEEYPEKMNFLVLGKTFDYFAKLTTTFTATTTFVFKQNKFIRYIKEAMNNDAEVAAAVHAALRTGNVPHLYLEQAPM